MCTATTHPNHTQVVEASPAQRKFLLSLVDQVLAPDFAPEVEAVVEQSLAPVADLVERLSLWLTVPQVLEDPEHLGHTDAEVDALVTAANASPITRRDTSRLIDALLSAKRVVPVDTSGQDDGKVRWTKHNGEWCLSGPKDVLVLGATVTVHKSNGSTQDKVVGPVVLDRGATVLAQVGKAATTGPKVDPATLLGAHLNADGEVVSVYVGQQSGNVLTKTWRDGAWVYTGQRGLAGLSEDTRLTAEQAAAFGRTSSFCCYCARRLEDGRSVDVGYGPVCAKKYGLPW